jgi:nucleotide-binding universal stress UspA family protein
MSSVICGVDDAPAESLLRVAAGLADWSGDDLVLVHVVSGAFPTVPWASSATPVLDTAEEEIRHGEPARELLAAARERETRLIVLGSHSGRRIGRALVGGTTMDVAVEAPCPVVVVPPRVYDLWPQWAEPGCRTKPSIVCGVDGSAASQAALGFAAMLAHSVGMRLLAAHVLERALPTARHEAAQLLRRATEPLDDGGVDLELRIEVGDVEARLRGLAVHEAAEFLVVGRRGSGDKPGGYIGSTALVLAAHAHVPVGVVDQTA